MDPGNIPGVQNHAQGYFMKKKKCEHKKQITVQHEDDPNIMITLCMLCGEVLEEHSSADYENMLPWDEEDD